ncbi:MAG: NADPH:quinone oxidoreductase family protein [Acidimicrobiales bacterium]
MKAWQVEGIGEPVEVLRRVEIEPPTPGKGQARVRVIAAGIGLPDVFMCRGSYPMTPALPFTPGQEVVGEVTAVGEGTDLAIGARVMAVSMFYAGHGSFAEECLVRADTAFTVPVGLSEVEAAGFWIPHHTAWIGLVERGRAAAGETLAVLGAAGGSGIAAVQVGKALGTRVIAVVGDQERAAFCRGLGADMTVIHRDGPIAEGLRKAADGRGIDLIYDPVGGELAENAAKALARNGRLLAVGFASGRWPTMNTHELVVANASVLGVFAGGLARTELDAIHASLSDLAANGQLRNPVSATVVFDDLPRAVQALADRRVIGKQVMAT